MDVNISNQEFIDWLNLDLQACSWEGRHLGQFTSFWNNTFSNENPALVNAELDKKIRSIRKGPLHSWLSWVQDSYLIYLFVVKDLSLSQLTEVSGRRRSDLLMLLWDFLSSQNLVFEEQLSSQLLINGTDLLACNLKYSELLSTIDEDFQAEVHDQLLGKLEVTLLPEWSKVYEEKVELVSERKIKSSKSSRLKFLQEVVVLFVIGGLFIFSVKLGNSWYQDHLINKISLFSPNFFWLDKNVSYLPEDALKNVQKDVTFEDFEALETEDENNKLDVSDEFRRFEVESDVVLTSIDSLPKDFNIADFERSSYEEIKKGGYRNNRWGRRRAYRVMLTSADITALKSKLSTYLSRYDVTQADKVKPGTMVPGGAYYNLYVPRKHLRQFLSLLSEEKDAVILESKTIHSGPKDRDKIFIWVKTI